MGFMQACRKRTINQGFDDSLHDEKIVFDHVPGLEFVWCRDLVSGAQRRLASNPVYDEDSLREVTESELERCLQKCRPDLSPRESPEPEYRTKKCAAASLYCTQRLAGFSYELEDVDLLLASEDAFVSMDFLVPASKALGLEPAPHEVDPDVLCGNVGPAILFSRQGPAGHFVVYLGPVGEDRYRFIDQGHVSDLSFSQVESLFEGREKAPAIFYGEFQIPWTMKAHGFIGFGIALLGVILITVALRRRRQVDASSPPVGEAA